MAEKKFGVDDLAKRIGKSPATCRDLLRKANVKKAGKGYGWSTLTELIAVGKRIGGEKKVKSTARRKVARNSGTRTRKKEAPAQAAAA